MEDDLKVFVEKANRVRDNLLDLSSDEDLSIALMNLISIEEHLYFTAMKTGNKKYIELLNTVRDVRKRHLKQIVREPDGEEWCISKHLLASSMRLIEVGTKHLSKNDEVMAEQAFNDAYNLYCLFWGINLKVDMGSNSGADVGNDNNGKVKIANSGDTGFIEKLRAKVKELINCCLE